MTHGSASTYTNHGCRCRPCKDAVARLKRERRGSFCKDCGEAERAFGHQYCSDCQGRHNVEHRSKTREWKEQHPGAVLAHREKERLKRYGLTPEAFAEMFAAQDSGCASCGCTEPSGKTWHVDHCHATGRVRAVLCHRCNVALGMLGDDPARVSMLLDYIGRHSCA